MKKATQLFKILSHNHTRPLTKNHAKVVIKIATIEERIKTMTSFGMIDKSKELKATLINIIETIKKEFIDKNNYDAN